MKHYHKELELIEGWLDRASALLGDDEDGGRKEGKGGFFLPMSREGNGRVIYFYRRKFVPTAYREAVNVGKNNFHRQMVNQAPVFIPLAMQL